MLSVRKDDGSAVVVREHAPERGAVLEGYDPLGAFPASKHRVGAVPPHRHQGCATKDDNRNGEDQHFANTPVTFSHAGAAVFQRVTSRPGTIAAG